MFYNQFKQINEINPNAPKPNALLADLLFQTVFSAKYLWNQGMVSMPL